MTEQELVSQYFKSKKVKEDIELLKVEAEKNLNKSIKQLSEYLINKESTSFYNGKSLRLGEPKRFVSWDKINDSKVFEWLKTQGYSEVYLHPKNVIKYIQGLIKQGITIPEYIVITEKPTIMIWVE
jgi:hypothetical protein